MHIVIIAIGKAKKSPESTLFYDYVKRIPWHVDLIEIESKKSLPETKRKLHEAELIQAKIPSDHKIITLDEKGNNLNSVKFAHTIQNWQDEGIHKLAFLIGGADGHHHSTLDVASLVLSFGTMTWPHLLVRTMLAEQLFRAYSILTGHPYHRP